METSVKIPDSVFARAEELADRAGITRDELYAKALVAYLKRAKGEDVTARINAALHSVPIEEQLDPLVNAAAEAMLRNVEWK